ncbi:ABC transporter ATP-binding protein [Candidatus Acetothermia bacterium]|nr:ABC transporter ATP-binding protein [Candidatus Acetothermia bacterium]MBI3643399.1 ABC transporter ATP-binding protein [Candidatus Acetothermia bacterium]
MLEMQEINVFYGKAQALHDIALDVQDGEFVSIIGPNGAGKTTLFNAISGLISYKGTIIFGGKVLPKKTYDTVQLGLIHCPEGRSLFPFMTVVDNLRLGAYRRKDKEVERDLQEVFELFPRLKERQRQLVRTLSGGEQQMVAIGRALMGKPRLLMLDEPTLGLAPIVRSHISKALDEIQSRHNVTILLAEQNADFAFKHSDRMYLLETGKIVRQGTSAELQYDPYIQQAYLGH